MTPHHNGNGWKTVCWQTGFLAPFVIVMVMVVPLVTATACQSSDETQTAKEQDKPQAAKGPVQEKPMNDYVFMVKHEDENLISVSFYVENDKPFAIGEKMNEINKQAYMNGYNWEAFFNYYLPKYAPDVCVGMAPDTEAGMYAAVYSLTPENETRAAKFVEVIRSLVENEEEIYRIVREEGDEIEWD